MITPATAHRQLRQFGAHSQASSRVPAATEYAFYALVLYGLVPLSWLPTPPLLGAALNGALAVWCVVRFGSPVAAPVMLPLACGISYVGLQLVVHGEPLTGDYVRPFAVWMFRLIVAQTLSSRPKFFHRFTAAMLLIGALLLTHLTFASEADFGRAGLDSSTGLSNPNDLAAWFGFLSVYFIVTGIESKRHFGRVGSWVTALGCLSVVGLTVSRGTLLAIFVAAVIAARRLMRAGFAPVLLLSIVAWLAYVSGLFEMATSSYLARATVETGRFLVWPYAIARFLESPLVGNGASSLSTYVPEAGRDITPHNGFLFLAVASGVVPLTLFAAYWWRAARGALSSQSDTGPDAPLRLPLLVYAFLIIQAGNMTFMEIWVVATLVLASVRSALPFRRARSTVPGHHRLPASYVR